MSRLLIACTLLHVAASYNVFQDNNDQQIHFASDSVGQCTPISANMTAPRTGKKAWDKCIEYQEEYVFPCKGDNSRGENCNHNAYQLDIGDNNARKAEFPHMAMLARGEKDNFTVYCGGSVLSDRFILTAATCRGNWDGLVNLVVVGTLRRSDKIDENNLYTIKSFIAHPDFKAPVRYHDIALLETEKRIRLYPYVIPACLDIGNQAVEEIVGTGWGNTFTDGPEADTLQKVKLSKIQEADCVKSFPPHRHLRAGIDVKTQVCYAPTEALKDMCQGSGGGPIQIKSAGLNCMYVVVGVTSFGRRCGVVEKPSVYTRVAAYVPWIESIVWP